MNSTSYGQSLLRQYLELFLPSFPFQENLRPEWLFGMELDFFNASLGVAFEFQGDQHFVPTERFGDCRDQKRRDARKRALCREKEILLIKVLPIDLIAPRMSNIVKRAIYFGKIYRKKRGLPRPKMNKHPPKDERKHLNMICTKYRHNLIDHYGSCVSRRKGRTRREAKQLLVEKWNAFQTNLARFGH